MKNNLLNESFKSNESSDYLMKQYQLYVNTALKISERREKANTFFVSLNTALLSIAGFVFSTIENMDKIWLILFSITGFILCYYWQRLIHSYKQLNTGKFKLIHEIEEKLPLRLFHYEWIVLGEDKDPNKYKSLSSIEKNIPFLFGFLYFTVSVYLLYVTYF